MYENPNNLIIGRKTKEKTNNHQWISNPHTHTLASVRILIKGKNNTVKQTECNIGVVVWGGAKLAAAVLLQNTVRPDSFK